MTTQTILHLGTEDFRQAVLESDKLVLVDFWADWCQPCHTLAPIIEQLAERYGDRITVAKVDIDAATALATQYAVNSIPTVLLFKDGAVAGRIAGVHPQQDYATAIDALLD